MTTKVGMSCDMRVIAQVLGQRTYNSNVLQVAEKELRQNAFDACKPHGKGNIHVKIGGGTNPITNTRGKFLCTVDDGIGMSADTVINVYLRMGGTLKEGLREDEKSGGFGIAKIQYLTQSEAIEIETVKDGIQTNVVTNAEQLFSNETLIHTKNTDKPNGTKVTVWYPADMDTYWPYSTYPNYFGMNIPNMGYPDIKVFYACESDKYIEVCKMDSKYSAKSNISFDWGNITVHYAPQEYKTSNSNIDVIVLSAGIFQFKKTFYDDNSTGLKFSVILDIHPTVDPHDLNYPINNSREGFSVTVKEDIKTLSKYLFDIQKVLNAELIRQTFSNMPRLQYTDVDGKAFENTGFIRPKQAELSPEFLLALVKAFDSMDSVYKKNSLTEEAEASCRAAMKSEADASENLRLLNQTDGIYEGASAVFSKVASVVADVITKVNKNVVDTTGLSAGICIKKNTRGLYLHSDMTAVFVNPLMDTVCGEVWVDCILETIIHELAHIKTCCHGETHNGEMRKIRSSLIFNGILLETDGKLRRIYHDHAAELEVLEEEFNKSNAVNTALE